MTTDGRLDVAKFLEDLSGRYARPYFEAIQDIFAAYVRNNRTALADARRKLERVCTETMGVAEVVGASLALRRAAAVYREHGAVLRADREHMLAFDRSDIQTILPRVTFDEAVEDMVARTPVTIRRAAERTAQRIAQLYSTGRVVAFVRAAEASVTKAAQGFIASAMAEGVPEGEAGARLAMTVEDIRKRSKAWSEGYARMVFRTNINTAVTAGRFRQVQDPDIREVIPAFAFQAVGDSDTRPNHLAADGIIMTAANHAWSHIAPPLGYNCRCQARFMTIPELQRLGRLRRDGSVIEDRVPSDAHPDPGFRHGGRPDLFLV